MVYGVDGVTHRATRCPFCGALIVHHGRTIAALVAHYDQEHPRRWRRLVERGR